MKIQKAIEILYLYLQDINRPPNPDAHDAMELGIEALKLIANIRVSMAHPENMILPGETEEN